MATIALNPIEMRSRGGHPVVITGLSPHHYDCIEGTITTRDNQIMEAQWCLSGYMRGGAENTNLDMSSDKLSDVVKLAKQLGAQRKCQLDPRTKSVPPA